MDAQKLYALHDLRAERLYIGVSADPKAHAVRAGGEVILETEVADPAAVLAFVRGELLYWCLGGGWFKAGVPQDALSALFTTARTYRPPPPKPLAALFDQALEAEVKADAPPAGLEVAPEGEQAGGDAARHERRKQALEARLIR